MAQRNLCPWQGFWPQDSYNEKRWERRQGIDFKNIWPKQLTGCWEKNITSVNRETRIWIDLKYFVLCSFLLAPPVGRLGTFVVLLSNNWEPENLSNFLLWPSYHIRCMYQPSSITNILITHPPFPVLPSKRKGRYLKFYRTPKVYLQMSKGARNLSEK